VPREINDWRKSDPERAIAAQSRIRDQFLAALAAGFVATAIEQTPAGGCYVFEPFSALKDDLHASL
jgi:hypothetical protein